MGTFDQKEHQRLQPFIKEGIYEMQRKLMQQQKRAYITTYLDAKVKGEHFIDGVQYSQNCTSIMRKFPN